MRFDQLKRLVEGEGLKYFVAPDREVVMIGMAGLFGNYQFVIPLELDGRFIQFRTLRYQTCRADHPSINTVLRVLAELNYRLRLTKFGWDPSDGEVVAYADLWLEDATLTQGQFSTMLKSYLPAIDVNYWRITKTIETGKDPGEPSPEQIATALGGMKPPQERERVPAGPLEV